MDDLGAFLRSRRARLTPEHVGIASFGARRVPGLRREELAQLAGVSATYYTRLEQGQSTNASESVIEALARALELDDDERAHLHRLARPGPSRASARGAARRRARARSGSSRRWACPRSCSAAAPTCWPGTARPPLLAGHIARRRPPAT